MPTEVIRALSRAIGFLDVDRPDGGAYGTAWLVEERHLLTCGHLVEGAARIRVSRVEGETRPVELAARHHAADLALLRLPEPTGADPLLLGPLEPVPLGTEVLFLGFPDADLFHPPLAMTRRAIVGNRREVRGIDHYALDVPAVVGESGAPVVRSDTGACIATLSARLDPAGARTRRRGSTPFAFAVLARHARELLDAADIPHRLADADEL